MKKILWLILFFILNTFVSGQNERVQIFLKNGSSNEFNIKDVKAWGLLNNEGFGASFSVIDSIKTSNKSLVDSIQFQFENSTYKMVKEEYIIDITNSKRKFIKQLKKSKFIPKSISVYYSFNQIEQLVYKLEYNTGVIYNILYKIEGSFGKHPENEVLFNQNFGFGIIYNLSLENIEIGTGLSITNFNNYAKESGVFKSLWVESFDLSFGIPLYEDEYVLRIDTNIYFKKLDVFDYNSIGTVRLGAGMRL